MRQRQVRPGHGCRTGHGRVEHTASVRGRAAVLWPTSITGRWPGSPRGASVRKACYWSCRPPKTGSGRRATSRSTAAARTDSSAVRPPPSPGGPKRSAGGPTASEGTAAPAHAHIEGQPTACRRPLAVVTEEGAERRGPLRGASTERVHRALPVPRGPPSRAMLPPPAPLTCERAHRPARWTLRPRAGPAHAPWSRPAPPTCPVGGGALPWPPPSSGRPSAAVAPPTRAPTAP